MNSFLGDSIVVAPSQTLSNEEYHMLRETALKVSFSFVYFVYVNTFSGSMCFVIYVYDSSSTGISDETLLF